MRGLGVGSRLVKQCIQRGRELDYDRLTLRTVDILASARKFISQLPSSFLRRIYMTHSARRTGERFEKVIEEEVVGGELLNGESGQFDL